MLPHLFRSGYNNFIIFSMQKDQRAKNDESVRRSYVESNHIFRGSVKLIVNGQRSTINQYHLWKVAANVHTYRYHAYRSQYQNERLCTYNNVLVCESNRMTQQKYKVCFVLSRTVSLVSLLSNRHDWIQFYLNHHLQIYCVSLYKHR